MSLRLRVVFAYRRLHGRRPLPHGQPPTLHAATPSQSYALTTPAPRYTLEAEGVDRAQSPSPPTWARQNRRRCIMH